MLSRGFGPLDEGAVLPRLRRAYVGHENTWKTTSVASAPTSAP
jgi:hypothetical protein